MKKKSIIFFKYFFLQKRYQNCNKGSINESLKRCYVNSNKQAN